MVPLMQGAPKFRGRPVPRGLGQSFKVAILGGGPSLWSAPVSDPSWLLASHASTARHIPNGYAPDILIDIHPEHCFKEERKNGFTDYYQFLRECRIPILMQRHYEDIPMSIRFPREQIKAMWPVPVGSQTAWLIGYYLLQGVTHLGFWGVHYDHGTEYEEQRASTEHWIGIARGMGVHIIIPDDSPLCHEPKLDYGYESHATPELYEERKRKFLEMKRAAGKGFTPDRLLVLNTPADYERAAAKRAENTFFMRETRKMHIEPLPAWLLDQEAKTRAESTQRAAHLHDAGRLPDGGREPEGAARPLDAGGSAGAPPVRGDGVLQPDVPAVHGRGDRRRPAHVRRPTGRRTPVARARRPARS